MKPLFSIRYVGAGVRPETVPARELAELLINADKAVLAIVRRAHPELDTEEVFLGLAEVRDASFELAFTSNRGAEVGAACRELADRLGRRDFPGLPPQSLDALRVLTEFSHDRHCRTQFWNGREDAAAPLLELESDFVLGLPAPTYVRGGTTLFGRVERVGGLKPRVRLRLAGERTISCDLNGTLAQAVGKRLYKEVGLRGTATWDAGTGSVIYFQAEELTPYEPSDAVSAFAELRAIVAGELDDVNDPDAFARELRYGADPEPLDQEARAEAGHDGP